MRKKNIPGSELYTENTRYLRRGQIKTSTMKESRKRHKTRRTYSRFDDQSVSRDGFAIGGDRVNHITVKRVLRSD